MRRATLLAVLLLVAAIPACAHGPAPGPRGALRVEGEGTLRVAAIQFPIRGSATPQAVMRRFERQVRESAAQGAQLVVFPELFTLDAISDKPGAAPDTEQIAALAEHFTPRLFARARALSQELKISILAGSSPRRVGEAIFNTAALSFPDGRQVFQDKVFLTQDEVAWKWTPGRGIQVIDAPWGTTVILICYDVELPVVSQLLTRARPELILVPSMTADRAGLLRVRWTAQARAVEHFAYVVVTGTVLAPRAEWPNHGQAAFITPADQGFPGLLRAGPRDADAIVVDTFDLELLRARRPSAPVYPAREQLQRRDPVELLPAAAVQ